MLNTCKGFTASRARQMFHCATARTDLHSANSAAGAPTLNLLFLYSLGTDRKQFPPHSVVGFIGNVPRPHTHVPVICGPMVLRQSKRSVSFPFRAIGKLSEPQRDSASINHANIKYETSYQTPCPGNNRKKKRNKSFIHCFISNSFSIYYSPFFVFYWCTQL